MSDKTIFSGPPPELKDAWPATQIQADFDRIALLSTDAWSHNNHYHGLPLKHMPSPCAEALDIGCGTGSFSRLLAQRSDRVLALDLSPQMIRVAWERSRPYMNIDFWKPNKYPGELPSMNILSRKA